MHSKSSQWQEDEIVETKALQLFALKEFMSALNYQYIEESIFTNPHFYSNHYSNKGRENIGFVTALKLYNGNTAKCIFGKPPATLSIWSFNDYFIAKARAARILTSLKLQLCKKTKTILVQDHRVQFTTPSYGRLFLNNKYVV